MELEAFPILGTVTQKLKKNRPFHVMQKKFKIIIALIKLIFFFLSFFFKET